MGTLLMHWTMRKMTKLDTVLCHNVKYNGAFSVFPTNGQHQPLKVSRQLVLNAVFNAHLCNLLIFIKN